MRKMYKQPKMEISKVSLKNIVCTSAGEGEGGTGSFGGKTTGDAPKRRTKVF